MLEDALTYDKPPSLVSSQKPEYPDFAREVRAEGRVMLKVLVLEDGSIGAVQVLESSHPLLTDNAIAAVRKTIFSPATLKGVPVRGTVVMPFVFTLDPNARTSVIEEPEGQGDFGNTEIHPPPPVQEEPTGHIGK
jgi:TonB family protein